MIKFDCERKRDDRNEAIKEKQLKKWKVSVQQFRSVCVCGGDGAKMTDHDDDGSDVVHSHVPFGESSWRLRWWREVVKYTFSASFRLSCYWYRSDVDTIRWALNVVEYGIVISTAVVYFPSDFRWFSTLRQAAISQTIKWHGKQFCWWSFSDATTCCEFECLNLVLVRIMWSQLHWFVIYPRRLFAIIRQSMRIWSHYPSSEPLGREETAPQCWRKCVRVLAIM